MKSFVLRIFTYIAILFITSNIFIGFEFDSFTAVLALAVVMTISHFTIEPAIKFLTIPINFFTFGLFNFAISCGLLYLFGLFMPGFDLTAGGIQPILNNNIEVSQVKLSELGLIVCASVVISILNSIVNWSSD